jgi:hypothetical protein
MALYPNEILTPHFITGAIEERPDRASIKQGYIGSRFFPMRTVPERRLTWDSMVAENNLAAFYGTKGEPIPGDDVNFKTHWANLIDVMAARHLDHDVINNVRAPGMAAVYRAGGSAHPIMGLRQRFEDHMRKSIAWCDDATDAQLEYLAINALWGSIVWPPTTAAGAAITPPMPHWNADMTVSFSYASAMTAAFSQNASTLAGYSSRTGGGYAWNNSSADPIKDLEVIAEHIVETVGVNADDMLLLMSRSTLSRIAYLSTVLNWLNSARYNTPLGTTVDLLALKEFIKSRLGWTIETYDAQWTYRTGFDAAPPTITRVKFLKEGRVIAVPKQTVSDIGYMATTYHKDGAGNFTAGKYSWLKEDDEPPFGTRLGIGLVSWPVIELGTAIYRLDAYA